MGRSGHGCRGADQGAHPGLTQPLFELGAVDGPVSGELLVPLGIPRREEPYRPGDVAAPTTVHPGCDDAAQRGRETGASQDAGELRDGRLAVQEGAEGGTAVRAVYVRFGGREGLLRALYRDAAMQMTGHHQAVPESDDMLAEVTALALAYRSGALSRPNAYALLMSTPPEVFEPGPDDRAISLESLERVVRALRRFASSGQLAACSPEEAGLQLWSLVHGLASLELRGVLGSGGPGGPQAEAVWRSAIATHVAGLGATR